MHEFSKDVDEEINVAAYFLARANHPIDRLCWDLSEKRLMYRNPEKDFTEEEVKHNAAAIYLSCVEYDVMCYLIAQLDILLKYELYGKDL